MQNHLFLTGDIQIGKSTLIEKFLQTYHGHLDGFRTTSHRTAGGNTIFLENTAGTEKHIIAEFSPTKKIVYDSVFIDYGVLYVKESHWGNGITLMDELGFMEQDILPFTSAVLNRLDCEKPVLGVVRKQNVPFLNKIKSHPQVKVLEVTLQNRETFFHELINFSKSYS